MKVVVRNEQSNVKVYKCLHNGQAIERTKRVRI